MQPCTTPGSGKNMVCGCVRWVGMAETIDPEGYNGWWLAWSGGKVDLVWSGFESFCSAKLIYHLSLTLNLG